MEQEFTVLENKTIGRNLYKFKKVKEKNVTHQPKKKQQKSKNENKIKQEGTRY